ncbi:JmjC domain-containing protein 4 [Apophysomyces ossiformis]|uniref:JmjC domain-containing protein 4 n=1 Tax=Apophysomyces ossiformis TaxID=679940 RepID=A0A8H7EL31_9FUNG|nr:JmjC domain-containing protein 4 [Apophysomyces ossiformis]
MLDEDTVRYYDEAPNYDTFLRDHLIPNEPALFGPALTALWKARSEWVVPNPEHGHADLCPRYIPNFQALRERYGKARVQVADCIDRDFTDQRRTDMSFEEFVNLWQDKETTSRYYLKDWHFVRACPEYNAYQVPDIFADDWLNEYWPQKDVGSDDYRFAYMGGHNTFTPFHADVYRSYSWSSNICGIKKWTLFPPGQEHLFKDKLGNMIYDIRNIDPVQFPNLHKAKRIVLYQRDGETLFVPSNWFHQVENIGATISINHNWSNACNLTYTYQSLENDLNDVRKAIADVQESSTPMEFTETCQQLLLVHSGWDWLVFVQMLLCITRRLYKQATSAALQPDVAWQGVQIKASLEKLNHEPYLSEYLERRGLGKEFGQLLQLADTLCSVQSKA